MKSKKTSVKALKPKKSSDDKRKTRGRTRPEVQFPVAPVSSELPADYADLLTDLKARIKGERLRVVLAGNTALVLMYWDIGQRILQKQTAQGWGARIIDRLSSDLHKAFPEMSGFSPRNLKYMRAFAAAWPDRAIVQQLAAQIPWFHNCILLDRVKDAVQREWYIHRTIEHGWSRNILSIQIDEEIEAELGGGE